MSYKAEVFDHKGTVTKTYDSGTQITVNLRGGFVEVCYDGNKVADIKARVDENEEIVKNW